MVTGTASDIGPEAMAANSHKVARATLAPAISGHQMSGRERLGNSPEAQTHSVIRTKPHMVTAAATRIGPMDRLTLPAIRSRVPQHSAATEPRRTGFIWRLSRSDAVGADQVLARRFEMSGDEIGGGGGIAHLERLE